MDGWTNMQLKPQKGLSVEWHAVVTFARAALMTGWRRAASWELKVSRKGVHGDRRRVL